MSTRDNVWLSIERATFQQGPSARNVIWCWAKFGGPDHGESQKSIKKMIPNKTWVLIEFNWLGCSQTLLQAWGQVVCDSQMAVSANLNWFKNRSLATLDLEYLRLILQRTTRFSPRKLDHWSIDEGPAAVGLSSEIYISEHTHFIMINFGHFQKVTVWLSSFLFLWVCLVNRPWCKVCDSNLKGLLFASLVSVSRYKLQCLMLYMKS